jgi:hypothetical protein
MLLVLAEHHEYLDLVVIGGLHDLLDAGLILDEGIHVLEYLLFQLLLMLV